MLCQFQVYSLRIQIYNTYILTFFRFLSLAGCYIDILNINSAIYYTVGASVLPTSYILGCICESQTPNLSLPLTFPFGLFVSYVCGSISVL